MEEPERPVANGVTGRIAWIFVFARLDKLRVLSLEGGRRWNADDSDVTVENKAVTRVDIGTVCWRTRKHVEADFPRISVAVFQIRRSGDQLFLLSWSTSRILITVREDSRFAPIFEFIFNEPRDFFV